MGPVWVSLVSSVGNEPKPLVSTPHQRSASLFQPFVVYRRSLNVLQIKEILMTKEGSVDKEYTQSVFYGEI